MGIGPGRCRSEQFKKIIHHIICFSLKPPIIRKIILFIISFLFSFWPRRQKYLILGNLFMSSAVLYFITYFMSIPCFYFYAYMYSYSHFHLHFLSYLYFYDNSMFIFTFILIFIPILIFMLFISIFICIFIFYFYLYAYIYLYFICIFA